MKLLIVDEEIIVGGVHTLRRQLMPALAKLVDEIVWVLPGYVAEDFRDLVEACGNVTIETLNSPASLGRIKEAVTRRMPGGIPRKLVDERLRRLARRHQSDICMTTCALGQEIPAVDLPVVGLVADINPALPQHVRDNVGKWVERTAMTLGISDFTCAELKRLKPACSARIHSVPLAGPGGTRPMAEGKPGSFYYPAAPNKHKGHMVLLEAARLLALRGLDYRLTLTGPGMDAVARPEGGGEVIAQIRAFLAEHSGLLAARVLVAGDVQPAGIERFFAGASCVVLPSSYEGYGFPLSEALAYGKRVICSDIPPFLEQIGRHGFDPMVTVVPVGNAAAFAEAMAAHLANGNHPGLTPDELQARINRWTWADTAQRCRHLLEGVAGHD